MVEGKVKDGYKKTEVGIIPNDWNYGLFKEMTDVLKCGVASTPHYVSNGVPFLSAQNVKENKLVIDKFQCISEEYHKKLTKYVKPQKKDILLTRVGAGFGETAIVDIDLEFSVYVSLTLIRMKSNYYPLYYVYLLNSNQYRAIAQKLIFQGGGVPNLNVKVVEKYLMIIPPFSEQYAIAGVLSDVDKLIQSLEKLIDKKKKIKQGTMQQLLTGNKRLPGFKMAWAKFKLNDLALFENGAAHENSISKNGEYVVVNSKFISSEGKIIKYSNENFCPALTNDILMVMSDLPNGKALAKCYYVNEDNKYTVNQRICILSPKNIDSKFLYYILNRNNYFLAFDDGVKQTNLRKEDVLNCELLIPTEEKEQSNIATIITDMDAKIESLEQKLEKYKKIKQGMMQELLTGRIRLI